MDIFMKRIPEEVLGVLSECETDGNLLFLPKRHLGRKLYLEVNKVLEAMGGKWNRSKQAHVFDHEAVEGLLDDLLLFEEYHDRPEELRKGLNFYETPPELANRMIDAAEIQSGDCVLEPSAGKGAIVKELRKREESHRIKKLHCIELDPDMASDLAANRFIVYQGNFLAMANHGHPFDIRGKYDVIIANPPFSKGRDAEHIMAMLKVARRRVVTIASAGLTFRQDWKYRELMDLLKKKGAVIETLPEDTFKESGTFVNTVLVVVDI
ncbi:MAG: SAM-dependent methyltransferase [Halobacteriota archaeon]|nr:SAM-dependent methyltransferase [Halobacteriota archaeon]